MKTFNEYSEAALKTAGSLDSSDLQLACSALGLSGEAGEVADIIKKVLSHGHDLDKDKIIKELGDVLWYLNRMAVHVGTTLDHVAEVNIAKLTARYPDGFSKAKSIERLDERG